MSFVAATPALAPPPSLILQQLGQSRGGRSLFDGLDFALHPGQLLWVQGANGSGKTSLLRVITGLAQPRTGRAHVERELLYIGHKPGLRDVLSVTRWSYVMAFAVIRRGVRPPIVAIFMSRDD
jgi:heme exporter protein A